MSTRKTTFFYAALLAVASIAVGMVIASRLDLPARSEAQALSAPPPMNSAPLSGPVDAGFGGHILHRTGHSLGEEVHGNGVHMDDYETHDDRKLLPGTGFTLEPGVYFPTFGLRTEINVFFDAGDARASGPRQSAIITLG